MAPGHGVAPTRRFVNHPGAKEAPADALKYEPKVDANPVLRGLPLVVASALITRSAWVRKLMWTNAKFGQARLEPGLENELWRLQPDVLPLADGPESQRMLELDDELCRPQPHDLPGRFMSVADYHGLYSRGEATPLDVVEALLPLIRRDVTPRSPYSVAWLQTDVDAVVAAARASTARWAAHAPLGILDGVPFGVKDDIPVAGFVSTMAIPHQPSEPYFQTPETETAWPVLQLQDAGAILLGKMNQHEIGMDTTGCNCGTGTPQNWYSPAHYPGGSSSGAGSALCAGIVPIAIGTDAGGSCRIPPAFCGVYGFKATHHRTGTMKSSVCVTAPMTATAADLAIAYRHMARPNPADPHQSLFATSLPPPRAENKKKYLGLCRPWLAQASPTVLATLDTTIARLVAAHGYEVVDIALPFLETGQYAHAATTLAESVAHAKTRCPPGTANYTGMLSHANRILLAVGAETSAPDYLRYGQVRQAMMAHLAALWERYPGMLVVSPTTPMAGWPRVEGDERFGLQDGNRAMRNMTYVWLANWVGCPAVSCPGGYEEVEGGGVLPVGVMAMGEWGEEERLLGWAREVEGLLERRRPEGWVDVGGLVRGMGRVQGKGDGGEGGASTSTMGYYKWGQHQETIRSMWVDQQKSLDEIMEYFRTEHNFTPSRRGFQTQIRRWGFPSRYKRAWRSEAFCARVRELWGQNVRQKQMFEILKAEGHDFEMRHLVRARMRLGLKLRDNSSAFGAGTLREDEDEDEEGDGGETSSDEDGEGDGEGEGEAGGGQGSAGQGRAPPPPPMDREEVLRRIEEKRIAVEQKHNELWATKKRRRHTKPYAGLPADPPGPPRYPSETTLTEAKAILQIESQELYKSLRDQFDRMWIAEGTFRKAGNQGRWQELLDRLIRDNMHLRAVMWDPEGMDQKRLALDVICQDSCKRYRCVEMSMAEAQRVLGLDPAQGRETRRILYTILAEAKFTSKSFEGRERWEQVKSRWLVEDQLLGAVVVQDGTPEEIKLRNKAVQAISKGVCTRYQGDVKKNGGPHQNPFLNDDYIQGVLQAANQPTPPAPPRYSHIHPPPLTPAPAPVAAPTASSGFAPSAVYFRLHPSSSVAAPALWISTLTAPSVGELRARAVDRFGAGNALCVGIEGIIKDPGGGEGTLPLPVSCDVELGAYLEHVRGTMAPTFSVTLVEGGQGQGQGGSGWA
ncbi:glutamyl-tRNA amidotransferase subunit A [Podospora conica]|nr:glutamyl-tRNA amidotransferase subunit A [Schizothecium conicum]